MRPTTETTANRKSHTVSTFRSVGILALALTMAGVLLSLLAPTAMACGMTGTCEGGGGVVNEPTGDQSDGTVRENYAGGGQVCSVYANGTGMGSYCVSGGSAVKSLRERFGSQTFQQCRYREIPDGVPIPFNSRPDEGRYMMQICLQNINFDTFSGGRNRLIKVDVVFVPNGTDIEDNNNGLNTFLWDSIENSQQLPVPFLYPRPNITPIVGVPTFFTFRWLDPADRTVVRDQAGPYADKPNGGPFKRITTANGLVMEAEATEITIDPRQRGIPKTVCRPGSPYNDGAGPNNQPAGACEMLFKWSSAAARAQSTVPIPSQVQDAFYGLIEVRWRIRYGTPGDMQDLGTGFTMRITQAIPVQEVQAPNQPPAVIY